MREIRRYLGLELSGAKNQKTAIAVLEYYPKEKKVFLLDLYDRIHEEGKTSDEALLNLLEELRESVVKMGVNVSLDLPPCIECTRKACLTPAGCLLPAVKWMRDLTKKAARNPELAKKVREFTPYTQRPIELWIRYQVLPKLPEAFRFEVDETLGGNRAPLNARMHYLMKHLKAYGLFEVWPKLTIAVLAVELGWTRRMVLNYRNLEEGAQMREKMLESLARHRGIFIYDRDVRKLSNSLAGFDSFISAYTAMLADNSGCEEAPHSFPAGQHWLQFPHLSQPKDRSASA